MYYWKFPFNIFGHCLIIVNGNSLERNTVKGLHLALASLPKHLSEMTSILEIKPIEWVKGIGSVSMVPLEQA